MKELPLVSIITPSYNQGRFIKKTIESVLNQDYPNIEYIVVDGGSTDDTIDILKEYGDQIKWISEKDDGQSDAINKGFKKAKGEIVAWLNSDDTYETGAVSSAVEYFSKHKDVALVYGECDFIDENDNKIKRFEATRSFDLWTLVHVSDYIMQPTTFFKREALENVGYLDKKLNWCMDWDLWIKISLKYKVGYINKVIANNRDYGETKTNTGGIKRFREIAYVMRKYGVYKFPPGYFIYGINTLVMLTRKIPIVSFVFKVLEYIIHRLVFCNLPIIHTDGWVGRKISLMLPPNIKTVRIQGQAVFKETIPLKAKIRSNGSVIYELSLDQLGDFEKTFDIQSKPDNIQYVSISLNKRISIFRYFKCFPDLRRLSIRIERIEYE